MMKYLCDPHVIPAVVPRVFSDIESNALLASPFTEWLHLDFADGVFTPDRNWPFEDFARLPPSMKYEVHLMVQDAVGAGDKLVKSGVHRIAVHRESFAEADPLQQTLARWKQSGVEVGVALLLETPISALEDVIDGCDFVQLMSIARVGHQGEPFDERVLPRVEELHAMYPDMMVAVDGGVSEATVEALVRAGANRLLVGAAISKSADPADTYRRIWERAMQGCAPIHAELAM